MWRENVRTVLNVVYKYVPKIKIVKCSKLSSSAHAISLYFQFLSRLHRFFCALEHLQRIRFHLMEPESWVLCESRVRVLVWDLSEAFWFGWLKMADVFEEEAEQTVSIQEFLKDVEDQELVSLFVYWDFRVSGECVSSPYMLFLGHVVEKPWEERAVWYIATRGSCHDLLGHFPLFWRISWELNISLCTARLSNNWIICSQLRVLLYLFFCGVLHESVLLLKWSICLLNLLDWWENGGVDRLSCL